MTTNIQVSAERARNYHFLSAAIEIDDAGQRITVTATKAAGTLIYAFNRSLRLMRVTREDGAVVQSVKGIGFLRGLVRRELADRELPTGVSAVAGSAAVAGGNAAAGYATSASEPGPLATPSSGSTLQLPAIHTPRRLRGELKGAFSILDRATTEDERVAARLLIERIKAEIAARHTAASPALIAVDKQHDRMIRNVGRNMHDAASLSAERGAQDDHSTRKQRHRLVRGKLRKFYMEIDERFPDPPASAVEVTEELLKQIATAVRETVAPMVGAWVVVKGDVAVVAHRMKINRAALRSILRTYAVNIAEMLGVGSLSVSQCRITLVR